jgi:AcrR family transcriptional regulator
MDDSAHSESLSRRERLKQEREGRILDAAAAVFARKGYHQATIHDIAQAADVADGTIYNYFADKFDLLIGIVSRMAYLEQLPAELMGALQGDARSFFVAAFQHRLSGIDQREDLLKAILPQVFFNPELREQFYRQYVQRIAWLLEQYVQRQVELGRMRPVDVPLTVRMIQGTIIGLLVLRILGDEALRAGWDKVPEALATLVFDGLGHVDGG